MIVVYTAARDETGKACVVKQVDPKHEDIVPIAKPLFGVFRWLDGWHTAMQYEPGQRFGKAVLVKTCKSMTSARAVATKLNRKV